MTFRPGPMQVIHNFFSTKEEVLDDIKKLNLWPTVYVSERMDELPPHWHDLDNCGYVMEGKSYVINEKNVKIPLGPGDKLYIPSGAIHAEIVCFCANRESELHVKHADFRLKAKCSYRSRHRILEHQRSFRVGFSTSRFCAHYKTLSQ